MLAYLPVILREELLSAPLERYTENTITDLSELHEELTRIRAQGYGTVYEELELGFVACAAPIFNHNGRVNAAISVGGPNVRFQSERMQELVEVVLQTAGRISQKIGFTGSEKDPIYRE